MNKKVVSLALAATLVATYMGSTVYASPYSNKATQEQQLKESKNKYKSAQEQVDEIEAKIQAINSLMTEIYVDIEDTNNKISYTENQIKISEEGVQAAEESIKQEEELFNKRMRAMYINGMDSYVETILNSKGLADFISRLENVTKIINYDKEVVASLTEKKVALEKQKDVLKEEKAQLLVLQEENQKRVDELNVKKEEHSKVMAEAEANRDVFEAAMKENEAQLKETLRQIENIEAASRPSRGDYDDSVIVEGNGSGGSIVSYAYGFRGTPYQWGGNGPSSFDCSGFTKYVYRANGISLPRTADSQMDTGTYVPRNQLQPGDLVFFGSGGHATHVGIYVGNNSYIHAPQDNEVVKISPLTRRDYLQARRHVN
ncbi:NlpC/P60 family protein [Clostridium sp.]|uniref:C40 family peptidase n=1 Tax=Clostridium sp. TaxID=1506 RepID=UPI002FC8C166